MTTAGSEQEEEGPVHNDDFHPVEPSVIAAGFFHSLVLGQRDAGKDGLDASRRNDQGREIPAEGNEQRRMIWAFGDNKNHALGIDKNWISDGGLGTSLAKKLSAFNKANQTQLVPEPYEVNAFEDRDIFHISCGGNHSAFLEKRANQSGGQVWTCGLGTSGRLGVRRPETKEEFESLVGLDAMKTDARGESRWPSFTTEDNYKAIREKTIQGSSGSSKWSIPYPVLVEFPTGDKIAFVSCGIDHTLACTVKGTVYAWGSGSCGQLGDGRTEDRFTPVEVKVPGNAFCRMVSAGSKHSLALSSKGLLFSWGQGGSGRLGLGERMEAALSPAQIKQVDDTMTWIAAGEAHSASIDTLGNLYCWGAGSYGRTGHGEDMDQPYPKPVASLAVHPCQRVALGTLHSLALTFKGEVWGWGTGAATGCVDPTDLQATQATPKALSFNLNEKGGVLNPPLVVQIAAGCFHSMALQENGLVYTWGVGTQGRLGLCLNTDGGAKAELPFNLAEQAVPMEVRITNTNSDEEVGGDGGLPKLCAVDPRAGSRKGEVLALENGKDGKQSQSTGSSQALVACGGMHSAFITKDKLWTWGVGQYGQHGHGGTDDAWKPRQVIVTDRPREVIKSVACGLEHCLAVTAGTELLVWGRNQCGQLGLGTTKDQDTPQYVHGLVDVARASAGEDHSAAVLLNGGLFTWGSAESGKLGHGTSMKSGLVQVPRRVPFTVPVEKAHCGVQHTAVVGKQGQLFTFGAGWFGRLGHGDKNNQYSPKKVDTFVEKFGTYDKPRAPEKIIDVQCASYHTCALSHDGELWNAGRDQMVLGQDHQLLFTLFLGLGEHNDARPEIKAISAAGKHTFALDVDGTLFAWGDNTCGQLGLDLQPATMVSEPCAVPVEKAVAARLKKQGRAAKLPNVTAISTGLSHSVAMLSTGEICAWGLRSGGRLGLAKKTAQKDNGHLSPELARLQLYSELVDGDWQTDLLEVEDKAAQPKDELKALTDAPTKDGAGKVELTATSRVTDISALQKKIQAEDSRFKAEKLREEETGLIFTYSEYINDIFHLWDKPAETDSSSMKRCEFKLRELRGQLDRSVCRNLQRMGLGDEYPSLDNLKVNPDVARKLIYYEELVGMLQQQPCYLARLAAKLPVDEEFRKKPSWHGEKAKELFLPKDLFPRVCLSIYKDIDNNRTRHLFMALVRRMATNEIRSKEVTSQASVDSIFTPKRSFVFRLMSEHILHSYFRDFHDVLFNLHDTDSLISVVEEWTCRVVRQKDAADDLHAHVDEPPDALFAFREQELLELENVGKKKHKKVDVNAEREELEHMRQRLQEQNLIFQLFLGCTFAENAEQHVKKETPDERKKTATNFRRWMERLVHHKPHQKCLQCMWKIIKKSEIVLSEHLYTDSNMGQSEDAQASKQRRKKVYEPLCRLFVGAILGHVLEHHEYLMTADHRRALRDRCKHKAKEPGIVEDDKSAQFKERVEEKIRKVHFNLKQLGKFLKKAAFGDFSDTQLHTFGDQVKSELVYPLLDERMQYDDDTEKLLTIDLYASHYDLDEHHVMFPTADLLNLSNALWYFQDDVIALPTENISDDDLFKCLKSLQPEPKEEEDEKKPDDENEKRDWDLLARCWDRLTIAEVEYHSTVHNLMVFHRFLELHQDLCFCRDCEAPIWRGMAAANQRQVQEVRLLKTYKQLEPRDPKNPTEPCPWASQFLELQALIANPDLPEIKSKEFLMMKFEFEEFQKNIALTVHSKHPETRSAEEYALVAEIDKGKKCLDALKSLVHSQPEKRFIDFVQDSMEHRAAHWRYLGSVDQGLKEIQEAQVNYKNRLEMMILTLEKALEFSEQMKVPKAIRDKASEKGVKLKYVEAKSRARQDNDDLKAFANPVPSATYSLYWLRYKGVIARMGSDGEKRMKPSDYRHVSFNFECEESGDWHIKALHKGVDMKQYMLFEFDIKLQELERMKRAGKTAKMGYNGDFLIINCFNLLQLLARIAAGV